MIDEAREPEYRGMIARYWDLLRGDTSTWADRAFHLELIRESGEPVLDVGCGTGRLLVDYLASGVDVDGVDNSSEMLALCGEKASRLDLAPRLYLQRMERLDLPRRYRTILVPSSSFQLLTDAAGAASAMRRFFAHLLPGGSLVMSFMALVEHDPSGWRLVAETTRPEDGAIVRRWSRSRIDRGARLEHTEDRYEVWCGEQLIGSAAHARSPATRFYTHDEAVALYRDAGFADLRLTKGFTADPADPGDRIFCVIGRRPPESLTR